MQFDRRTLIALVLTAAVVILWEVVILEPQAKARRAWLLAQDSARVAAGATEAPTLATPHAEPSVESATPEAIASAKAAESLLKSPDSEKDVLVETDLFRAAFNTRGAKLKSLVLFRYPSYHGGVVDLIPSGSAGAYGVSIRTDAGDVPLDDFVFASSVDSLIKGAGPEGPSIAFTGEPMPGLRVTKRFTTTPGSYDWTLDVTVERSAGAPAVYAVQIRQDDGIALTERNEADDAAFLFGAISEGTRVHRKPLYKVHRAQGGKVKLMEPRAEAAQALRWSGAFNWSAISSKYFIMAMGADLPPGAAPPEVGFLPGGALQRMGIQVTLPVPLSTRETRRVRFYAGPQEMRALETSPLHLGEAVSFGWIWIEPISKILLRALRFIHKLIPNYGVAIILVSIATKLAFFRLTHQSMKSMGDMKKIQGELESLRKRFKSDATRLNTETMALYKKHGVNPLSGCLPMMLQTPVFIALYNVLRRTIELRGAPFMFWIKDLAAPDAAFPLPPMLQFLGPDMNVLPIIMGTATYMQQKMTTVDPKQLPMVTIMPVMMTFLFFQVPSGLVLYWLTNTVFSVGQQYYYNRSERAKDAALAAAAAR